MNEKFPLALPAGTVLAGQYIIETVLGQGGFGITYEAKDHKTGERVAVKEFFPDAMATRTNQLAVSAFSGERGESFAYGKTCFLQEAETLSKFIGNEHIVRIRSYFEENETAYFVMDFVEGTSFDEYLKQRGGRIPYEEAAGILVPMMDALSAVHSKGIIHRDVTPDNIYIASNGMVKLLDFGAARYSLGDRSRSLDIILKHGFAPKEQYTRRGKQGPYTDVYALGATFYFALTGRHPPDSVERMDGDDLVPPSTLGVQISTREEDAILKALSVQPADRFQSMVDFKNALGSSTVRPPLAAVGSRPTVSQIYFNAPNEAGETPAEKRAAAEADTCEAEIPDTAGHSLGENVPSAKPVKSKKPLFIAGGVIAALLIVFIALGQGGTNPNTPSNIGESASVQTPTPKPTDTPEPTDTPKPTDTPEPSKASSGNLAVLGSSAANLTNYGIFTIYDSVKYSVENDGRSIYSAKEKTYIYTCDGSERIWNLMGVDGKLYFLTGSMFMEAKILGSGYWGGRLFAYDLETGETEQMDSLGDYVPMLQVLITDDYYFISSRSKSGEDLVRLPRENPNTASEYRFGTTDDRLGFGNTFTLSNDGWLYYTGRGEENEPGVYRVPGDAREGDGSQRLVYSSTGCPFGNPIVVDDYLYVSSYNPANSSYSILRMDREAGYDKDTSVVWKISNQLDYEIPKDVFGFTINRKTHEIYLYAGYENENGTGGIRLYRMTGQEDGTFELKLIYGNGFLPNLSYFQNGDYQIDFFSVFPDEEEQIRHYYFRFDSEGNQVND